MKKLIVDVSEMESATWVEAVRLEKGRKLEAWVRDVLNDAATLELAQKKVGTQGQGCESLTLTLSQTIAG
jgi:hypothetical protein